MTGPVREPQRTAATMTTDASFEWRIRERVVADIKSNADLIAEYVVDEECAVHLIAMLVGLARGDQP